jgi:hypothetical protein
VDIRSYKPSIQGNKLQIKRAVAAIEKSKKPLFRLNRILTPQAKLLCIFIGRYTVEFKFIGKKIRL